MKNRSRLGKSEVYLSSSTHVQQPIQRRIEVRKKVKLRDFRRNDVAGQLDAVVHVAVHLGFDVDVDCC